MVFGLMMTNNNLEAQDASKDNFTLKVDGLGCPFCAYGLEKKFKEFKGIDDVNIEMETGVFTFSYPAHDGLSMEKVESQVAAAGYTAVAVNVLRSNGAEEVLAAQNTSLEDGATIEESSIDVSGNCGMCKARIEKSAKKVKGVVSAKWDKKTKVLELKFNSSQTNKEEIANAVSASGHDNEFYVTDRQTYESLPGCCKYDRVN